MIFLKLSIISFFIASLSSCKTTQEAEGSLSSPQKWMGGNGGKENLLSCGGNPVTKVYLSRTRKNGTLRINKVAIRCAGEPGLQQTRGLAPTIKPDLGKANGYQDHQKCNGLIRGISGRSGDEVDGFHLVCDHGTPNPAFFGGPGGKHSTSGCKKDHYVSGFSYRANVRLDGIQVICAKEKKHNKHKYKKEIDKARKKLKEVKSKCGWAELGEASTIAGLVASCGGAVASVGLNWMADVGCVGSVGGFIASLHGAGQNCSKVRLQCHKWMHAIFTHKDCAEKGRANKGCAKRISGYEKNCGKWPF